MLIKILDLILAELVIDEIKMQSPSLAELLMLDQSSVIEVGNVA